MNQLARRSFTGLLATSALTLAGCATSGSGGDDNGQSDPDGVSDQIPDEEVTLRLAFVNDPPTEALVEAFLAKHSNVTIDTEQTDFGNYVGSITRSMSSSDAPDIAQYTPGAMRSLVPAGHVLELGPYSELYDWEEAFPMASLGPLMSDEEAQQFGTGELYAAPGALSVLGVYYNQALLEEAGVSMPLATLGEFEEALATVSNAGISPLSLGALEVGAFQLWNALLNSLGDSQEYVDWVYGAPGSTIETDAAREAAEMIAQWVEDGYISEGANAVSDADALAAFTDGNAAFHVTGNWNASTVEAEMGSDAGFFFLPGASPDDPLISSGSSVAYSISPQSEYPDVAAAFLNWLSSSEAAQLQVEAGYMPVDTEAEVASEGLLGDIAESFAPVAENDNIVPFPDYAAPGMIDVLTSGLQGIISGENNADSYLASLQETWASHHG